jgi:hypothetical protein
MSTTIYIMLVLSPLRQILIVHLFVLSLTSRRITSRIAFYTGEKTRTISFHHAQAMRGRSCIGTGKAHPNSKVAPEGE